MHYFIDGYNFIFRLPKQTGALESERERLIASLISLNLPMTLVFDGGMDNHVHRSHKGHLEIVYTGKKQSADEYILEEICRRKKPNACTVVTSDKKLATLCQESGSHSQSISSFLSRLKKNKTKILAEKPSKDTQGQVERLAKIFNQQS